MKSFFGPWRVVSSGGLYESNIPLRNEERTEGAVEMVYQGGHRVTEPFRAVVGSVMIFRLGCEGAGLE